MKIRCVNELHAGTRDNPACRECGWSCIKEPLVHMCKDCGERPQAKGRQCVRCYCARYAMPTKRELTEEQMDALALEMDARKL